MPNSWIQDLKDLICRIYREWGGDCANLPLGVSDQIAAIRKNYDQMGAPTFSDLASKQSYLALLSDTEAHLDRPDNSLSSEDDARLRSLIDSLQQDLGAPGAADS